MGQSIELKKREIAELKKKSDKLKAEVKAHEEKIGECLELTFFTLRTMPGYVAVQLTTNHKDITVAKSEVPRLKRFIGIVAEKYGV